MRVLGRLSAALAVVVVASAQQGLQFSDPRMPGENESSKPPVCPDCGDPLEVEPNSSFGACSSGHIIDLTRVITPDPGVDDDAASPPQ